MNLTNRLGGSSRFGPLGDITDEPTIPDNFTKLDSAFFGCINGPTQLPSPKQQPAQNYTNSRTPSRNLEPQPIPTASQLATKRNPEEIVRQLNQKRRPLLESQETIQYYKSENLKLKLKLNRVIKLLEQHSINPEDIYTEDDKRDIVDELKACNEDLLRKLEERDRKEKREEIKLKNRFRDRGCQTNLDSMNIEKLVEASVTLKKQMGQPRQSQANQKHQAIQCSMQPSHNRQHDDPEKHTQQNSVITRIHYPVVTLPLPQQPQQQQQPISHKTPLYPDEKEILETAYKVKGILTTASDKLKTRSDLH